MLDTLPILVLSGFSGSGKTALIKNIIPHLLRRNLKTAVVKHSHHTPDIDRSGKDSDIFFKAGADVFLQGGENFNHLHTDKEHDLNHFLITLSGRYDIVLVEGYKRSEIPKIWLLGPEDEIPPSDIPSIMEILPWNVDRPEMLLRFIDNWLPVQWTKPPVWGCVLIGGKSARMGRPKHLIADENGTWVEQAVQKLERITDKVIISGTGEAPKGLSEYVRIPDAPGISGPLAGILAAMRWAPRVTWLPLACDLPDVTEEALSWLLNLRKPGTWATLPSVTKNTCEPLLAWYDFRALPLLEEHVAHNNFRPNAIASHPKVSTPEPPEHLKPCWRNVNTKEDLE